MEGRRPAFFSGEILWLHRVMFDIGDTDMRQHAA
jgi:hypothetical protein